MHMIEIGKILTFFLYIFIKMYATMFLRHILSASGQLKRKQSRYGRAHTKNNKSGKILPFA